MKRLKSLSVLKLKNLSTFLEKQNMQLTDGEIVGKHQGAHYFTKGQRKGLICWW